MKNNPEHTFRLWLMPSDILVARQEQSSSLIPSAAEEKSVRTPVRTLYTEKSNLANTED